ncbi:MAG: hypothetical protein ABW352_05710 [Polyangiales bacterium]
MRLLLPLLLTLLCAARASAQSDAGTPSVVAEEPRIESTPHYREPGAEFRWQPPAEVGSCLGGTCGVAPPAQAAPQLVPSGDRPPVDPRQRFAYTGAVLGVVSAGLVLGSSVAIALVDDQPSERITRGVWLGYFTLSTGVVVLSSMLAHHELGGTSERSKATRSVGWTAFALALADGAILWAGAFQRFENVDALTIGAGAIGACALLPFALDAYVAGRGLRARSLVSLEPAPNGLRVRF